MTKVEKQAHDNLSDIPESKQMRDFLRLLKERHQFVHIDARHWECKKQDGTTYQIFVSADKQVCTCPAYGVCAHIHAIWVMQRIMPQLEN